MPPAAAAASPRSSRLRSHARAERRSRRAASPSRLCLAYSPHPLAPHAHTLRRTPRAATPSRTTSLPPRRASGGARAPTGALPLSFVRRAPPTPPASRRSTPRAHAQHTHSHRPPFPLPTLSQVKMPGYNNPHLLAFGVIFAVSTSRLRRASGAPRFRTRGGRARRLTNTQHTRPPLSPLLSPSSQFFDAFGIGANDVVSAREDRRSATARDAVVGRQDRLRPHPSRSAGISPRQQHARPSDGAGPVLMAPILQAHRSRARTTSPSIPRPVLPLPSFPLRPTPSPPP